MTVEGKCGEIGVAVLAKVHPHAVEDFVEVFLADVKWPQCRLQGPRDRVLGIAGVQLRNFIAPPGKPSLRDMRVAGFVHGIVDFPAESVKGGDRPPAFRWQEQERVIKRRAALRGLVLAILVSGHAKIIRASAGLFSGGRARKSLAALSWQYSSAVMRK